MSKITSTKIKILHVISGDLWAGAEVMAFNLLKYLKGDSSLELAAIILNEGKLADLLRQTGVTVHVIDERRHSFWQIVRRTRVILSKFSPDIIHSHRYKENALALLASPIGGRSKLFSTQHGLPELAVSKALRFKFWLNFQMLARVFSQTVAVSRDLKEVLAEQFSFREERLAVILNGIELPRLLPPEDRPGPFVIGSSGRLFRVKDFPLMIEIASQIGSAKGGGIRFELAGEGPERSRLENLIERRGLGNRFLLKGHQDDMGTFYRGLDMYINTSVHEGIPMAVLEALARGLPVVAPAVGGICEIIEDGVQGFLVRGRDPGLFAEKCCLIREDRVLREKMSIAARKRVEQAFSVERMAENYLQLYRHAICSKSPGR